MPIKLQGTNSAAAPGLTNDGGDGVVVGTDSVDISTGGTSRLKVDSSGNVGIGTTSPNSFTNYTTLTINGGSDGAGIDLERSDNNIYGRIFADANGLQIQSAQSGDSIRFETNGANVRARVTDNGLCFNADTAAANALDDYETGTFTPTYGNGTISYNWQRGFYHKIGCMVTIWFDVGFSCSSQSGVPYLGGLPFGKSMNSSSGHYEGISWWHLDDVFTGTKPCANGYMSDNTSTINLYRGDTNQHTSGGFVLDQTGRLSGSFSYSSTA